MIFSQVRVHVHITGRQSVTHSLVHKKKLKLREKSISVRNSKVQIVCALNYFRTRWSVEENEGMSLLGVL